MGEAYLPSSSGREKFLINFKSFPMSGDGLSMVEVEMAITGVFWPQFRRVDAASGLPLDFNVTFPQLILGWTAVDELIVHLGEWLDRQHPFRAELCPKPIDESFTLEISPDEHSASVLQKPLCVLGYRGHTFRRAEWIFVVDESCIRIFYESLRTAFNQSAAAS